MNGYGRGLFGLPPVVKNIIMLNVLMLLAYYAASSVFSVDQSGPEQMAHRLPHLL